MFKIAYLPLLIFLIFTTVTSFFFIPREPGMIISFASYLFWFSFTTISALKESIKNRYAILKLNKKTPYLLPFIFFSIPTIIITSVCIPRRADAVISFSICFFLSLLIYILSIFLILRKIRREDKKHEENKNIDKINILLNSKKKLVLINPVNLTKSGLTINNSSRFPPLGLGIIASLTPDDYEIKLIDENINPFVFEEADLAGITAFTSSAARAYEIAGQYKQKGIPVVMGGIHASMCPEEAGKFVDAVVIGEAETVWKDVIIDFESKRLKPLYRGGYPELSGSAVPRRDIFSPEYAFAAVQTSRGCPMDCYFCSVSAFNGRKYRQRPVNEVLEEIVNIETSLLFFADDNILGYGKEAEERAIAIFRGMAERKMGKSWFCQASINFGLNDEMLYWAQKSGCKMVFIGLESSNPAELESMNKHLNINTDYKKAFEKIHRHGIAVLGAFIFGSDSETLDGMENKSKYICREAIDSIQTTILTPLPGTRLFEQYSREKRLKYPLEKANWVHYDMSELTYRLKNITDEEFNRKLEKCSWRIYSNRTLKRKFLITLWKTWSLETALWAYNSNQVYRNVGKSISKEDKRRQNARN